jgi:hypothetical protein
VAVFSSESKNSIQVYHNAFVHSSKYSARYNFYVLPDLRLNDMLRLRKPHPCGSYEWTVVRLGADIGLQCNSCGRRVMLTRRELARRMKANLTKHDDQPEP